MLKFKAVPHTALVSRLLCAALLLPVFVSLPLQAQAPNTGLIERIDSSVHARDENLAGYTVIEHYALYRGRDQQRQEADLVVKTTYRRDAGKSYTIVSENGSELMRKLLETILDTEKRMTQPTNRATAIITSNNYEMSVKGRESLAGRDCIAVNLKPKRNSPYLFNGSIWVDAQDGSIVQLQGTASKAPSVFAGPSQVLRSYAPIGGFPMATHATAVSNSWALGPTTIKIDYTNYQIETQSGQ